MLYVFAGFPKCGLNAGGLEYAIEEVENLAMLEHEPIVQYRKEGQFAVSGEQAEWVAPITYRMSDQCQADGITWDWFPEHFSFGNGVAVSKTVALVQHENVIVGTDLNLEEYLKEHGPTRLNDLSMESRLVRHEGRKRYESRWLPGTCPDYNHLVHLTWVVAQYCWPEHIYERVRQIVEDSEVVLTSSERYDPKLHISLIRPWIRTSNDYKQRNN
jgi:hypothetical protein